MIELLLLAIAVFVFRQQLAGFTAAPGALVKPRASPQLIQLAEYADRLYAEHKWLAAEKAYLSVLKLDHKNVTAYSHLGIIYSTQKNMPDALECFNIAVRLKPSASTYQNLGLAFYENKNYMKSIAAFDKAIMFEPSIHRYVGLSKAYKQISNTVEMIAALERAAKFEPGKKILQLLATAYEDNGRKDEAKEAYRSIYTLDPADTEAARHIGISLPKTA